MQFRETPFSGRDNKRLDLCKYWFLLYINAYLICHWNNLLSKNVLDAYGSYSKCISWKWSTLLPLSFMTLSIYICRRVCIHSVCGLTVIILRIIFTSRINFLFEKICGHEYLSFKLSMQFLSPPVHCFLYVWISLTRTKFKSQEPLHLGSIIGVHVTTCAPF